MTAKKRLGSIAAEAERRHHRQRGDMGALWARTLPLELAHFERVWGLRVDELLPAGFTSCCFGCTTATGGQAILKLIAPWTSAGSEIRALLAWQERGAVDILAHDVHRRGLLMHRAFPGEPFLPGDDQADTRRIARLFERIHAVAVPDAGSFPPLADLVDFRARRAAAAEPLAPHGRLETAVSLARRLIATAGPSRAVLLHGDALSQNLLWHGRQLRVIDPTPHVGDRAFDLANWAVLHNPHGGLDARLLALAAMTGEDRERLGLWAWFVAATEFPRADSPYAWYLHSRRAAVTEYVGCHCGGMGADRGLVQVAAT